LKFIMRTFIGIDFDTSMKNGIKTVQSIVRQNAEKGRFKYVGNFHITLKFLGEIPRENTRVINDVLKDCASTHKAFNLGIDKLGFFRGRGSIHALWLGLCGELNSLIALHKSIEEGLALKGFKKDERSYSPHITIAQDLILKIDFEKLQKVVDLGIIPSFKVKEVSLIKSQQIEGKRVYTPISTFQLLKY
ncbi:MAG: RNA 2',3'-cyclic phosphodiesterase, partial [Clostridia bacterium]|nr:RNA 2',3'-cyclic phosphodiesterase [Clostridia bacterium]